MSKTFHVCRAIRWLTGRKTPHTTAILLAGGSGSRMGKGAVTKQMLLLDGTPVVLHTLRAFEKCGLDTAFYANRERPYEELLPWSFIDMGVTEQYLRLESERAKKGITTRDCRKGCNGCGLQRYEGMCAV